MHRTWMKVLLTIESEALTKQGEPIVRCTGMKPGTKTNFPFSWVLFEDIEKILQSCLENKIRKFITISLSSLRSPDHSGYIL